MGRRDQKPIAPRGEPGDQHLDSPFPPQLGAGVTLSANNITVSGFTIRNHAVGIILYSSHNKVEGDIITHNDGNVNLHINHLTSGITDAG